MFTLTSAAQISDVPEKRENAPPDVRMSQQRNDSLTALVTVSCLHY